MSIYLSDENKKLKKLAGRLNNIDSILDPESTNPVQNKVITKALNEVNKLIDDIPENVLNAHYTKSETDDKINNNVNVKFAESERQKTLNLFDASTITRGYSLSGSTGEILSDALWYVSDYINVQGLSTIIISGLRDSGRSNCFYDANKTYISTFNAITGTIIVPPNAVYMRINGIQSQLGDGYTIITQGDIVHENMISGMNGIELWKNPNPTASFGTQNITLRSSDYDYLEIYWFASTSNLRSSVSVFDRNSNNYGFIMSWANTGSQGARSFIRNADVGRYDGDFTKVHFEVAWEARGATAEFTNNDACIPYKIIGYKGVRYEGMY